MNHGITPIYAAAALLFATHSSAQTEFVRASEGRLVEGGRTFTFAGVNAYFLQQRAASGDTAVVGEIFGVASAFNIRVIRTWAFFDSPDSGNPAVIQYQPGAYNERALRGLDLVLDRARRTGVRLILPLVNSWDDYGGMNQYVSWYAEAHPPRTSPIPSSTTVVRGARGSSYRVSAAAGYQHDDFYRIAAIQDWYRAYVSTIVTRVNTVNGIPYKDDPTILAWELANEPRSSDRTGAIVSAWIRSTSAYLKSIDPAHLVGTGEEGFDVFPEGYSPPGDYDGQAWLFDGTGGTSYSTNLLLPGIDFGGAHLYPDAWQFAPAAGKRWISDHVKFARYAGKPFLMGEFGITHDKAAILGSWYERILDDGASGGLAWDLVDSGSASKDGYAFSYPADSALLGIFPKFAALLDERTDRPIPKQYEIFQNYPNPFNPATTISYGLPVTSPVRLLIFDAAGREVRVLVDEEQPAGMHAFRFNAAGLASGFYLCRFVLGTGVGSIKMMVLK